MANTSLPGRGNAEYDIKPSELQETGTKHGLEKVEISGGQFINFTAVFVVGLRDKAVHITSLGYYLMQLEALYH
jgi:hypothetical protein